MNSPATTDEALVAGIQAGESALCEILVDRYHQSLHCLVTGILHGDSESEDVMQETYLQAFDRLHQLRDTSSFSTWLRRIAVNKALQYRRSTWRLQYIGDELATERPTTVSSSCSGFGDPERQAAASELRAALDDAIEALRPQSRAVFVMREVEHLTTHEIASRLGITEACAKTRLHRARKQLRQSLARAATNSRRSRCRSWRSPSVAMWIAEAA